jgi:hypothetical protein
MKESEWAGHVASVGERRRLYRVLVGKPEGKRPLEKPRLRWGIGSRWTFGRLAGVGVEWIHLAQVMDHWWAVVDVVMNLRVLAPQI